MSAKISHFSILAVVFLLSGGFTFADCPSADFTGDCFVDFEDFAVIGANWPGEYDWNDVNTLAYEWLTTDSCVPDDMAYIPDGQFDMGNHYEDRSNELPVHTVYLDSFYMSTCEITNQQYCDFLNSAYDGGEIKVDDGVVYASSDDSNSYPYCDTNSYSSYSQIDYSGGVFSVKEKGGRDMSNDPMVEISWYGAVVYCNWISQEEGFEQCYNLSTWDCNFSKHGYRLPTEAEWEYAARGGLHSPYYRFGWGDTISHSQANYYSNWSGGSPYYPYDVSSTEGYHPDWNDGVHPYTSPVGTFSANAYGLYDMTGNTWEWCNDWYDADYYNWCKNVCGEPCPNPTGPDSGIYRVLRGGSWDDNAYLCRVSTRYGFYPDYRKQYYGFRVVLDLH